MFTIIVSRDDVLTLLAGLACLADDTDEKELHGEAAERLYEQLRPLLD